MPMPIDLFQDGDESILEFAPPTRGMKRGHEPDPDDGDDGDDGDTPRRGWKRLTTKEEVTLFEICNRHADSFGRRSDLCNWWKNVAAEFSHANGRPYSWHSVRRKVETLTKKRIKFLQDQQQRQRDLSGANVVPDVMNPQWCAVLDLWIPTWQNWEAAEARRIARRDSINHNKRARRKSRNDGDVNENGNINMNRDGDQWRLQQRGAQVAEPFDLTSPTSPDDDGVDVADSYEGPIVLVTRSPQPPAVPAATAAPLIETPRSTGGVRLPPGFDTMFASNHIQSNRSAPAVPSANRTAAEPPADTRLVNAVLETLGKLNRHLDTASSNTHGMSDARSSSVISTLLHTATDSTAQNQSFQESRHAATASNNGSQMDIERMKEELRREIREEFRREIKEELRQDRAGLEEKLDAVQRTQDMILEMLRQEPA